MTASALPSLLRALWRLLAREITAPLFHRQRAGTWRSQDLRPQLREFQPATPPEKEPERTEPQAEPPAPLKQPDLRAPPPCRRRPSRYAELIARHTCDERAKKDEQKQDSEWDQERDAGPGTTMRSPDMDHMARPKPIPRPCPAIIANLLDIFGSGKKPPAIFRQIAWLTTVSNLPSKLRTLWRVTAREMTAPPFHSKRPRKAKSPRPF